MAATRRRQIWTSISIIYLLGLMGMAAYALQTSNALTLPVPNILSALGLALPPLAGLALETSLSMTTAAARTKPDAQHIRPYVLQLVAAFFLIYEAVLATLAGSHLAPVAGLDCALRERWQHLFRTKDGPAIRAVQDRFDCCGLASPRDMAWPFPSAADGRGSDACLVRYDRTAACLGPWREAERRVAGLLLGVALGVFIWQVLFLYIGPESTPDWLPSTVQLPFDDDAPDRGGTQRRIEYRDEEDPAEADSLAGEVRRLNADSRLASHVEAGRANKTSLVQEHRNQWAEEDDA